MSENNRSFLRKLTDKVYGGLNMSWRNVILFAVGTAIVTAVFLIVPIFKDTSFERMGVTFEAWIFFAVIIMANCKTPLDSALKTFVFFLISQPLIYLIQVPFSAMGWKLFGYYYNWFLWTLLTFPMAYAGWYIRKKNWLSVVILLPILYMLTSDYVGAFRHAFHHFPRLIVTAFFCLGQVLLYVYTFTENIWQKAVGFLAPLLVMVLLMLVTPPLEINGTQFLPNEPVLSENAVVEMEENDFAEVTIESTGTDSLVRVHAAKYGGTSFVIKDGEQEYHYLLDVYEDDAGHVQIRITFVE
ncbi:MAG: hypothetical protein IKS37_01250 [Solobacterium sp.]|nr:hypothetical protein [Solobacterium sp.]